MPEEVFPEPVSPSVFVSIRGTRMSKDSIHATFPVLVDKAGLTGLGQRPRPRICCKGDHRDEGRSDAERSENTTNFKSG